MDIALQPQKARTPPGRIGIWLFLASEIMFFMGLLVSYVLFRGTDPQLFSQQSVVMNKWAGGINTLILLSSSFFMAMSVSAAANNNRRKMVAALSLVLLLAASFLGIKSWEYREKLTHYTLVARGSDGKMTMYDGHVRWLGEKVELEGYAAPMPPGNTWDIHLATPNQMREAGDGVEKTYEIASNSIVEQISDGPWKNMFFACYFLLTAVHAVHLFGGMMVALALLFMASRGKIRPAAAEYLGIYWHFVDLVWIFLFVLLYLR
jgi:cytochrome c oxidase subunit III